MPRYKAEAKLFVTDPVTSIGRLVRPGEIFNSNEPPGKHWEGVDKEGKEAVKARPAGVLSSREAALEREADKRTEQKQTTKEENDKRAQTKLKEPAKAPARD